VSALPGPLKWSTTGVRNWQDVDIGSHILIQTVECGLYAVFQFPPSAPLRAGDELTVYAGHGASSGPCATRDSKNQYFFTSRPRWASGPSCVTVLTRPDDKVRSTASRKNAAF